MSSYTGSESFDVDMLNSILCSAVQAVAGSALGIYHPAKKRKQQDTTGKRLANKLDINSIIQLFKRTQRASTVGVNLVSSTDQSTPIHECIKHYSKMLNSPTLLTNMDSDKLISFSSHSARLYEPSAFSRVDRTPLLDPPDERMLLDSGLLDRISPEKIKYQLGLMSSTASSGTDGITVMMLRTLLDTSFTQHLFQLYYTCVRKAKPHDGGMRLAYILYIRTRQKPIQQATNVQ